jgi:hypothetical protein
MRGLRGSQTGNRSRENMDMYATVTRINIPADSTLGYGEAVTDDGTTYAFAGDHRPMLYIGEALKAGDEPRIDLDNGFILAINKVEEQVAA